MSLRFLNDHQHIYRHIDALIVHMQIIISQNIGKLYIVITVSQNICQGTMSFVVFSGFNLYWNYFSILSNHKVQFSLFLAVEVMQTSCRLVWLPLE